MCVPITNARPWSERWRPIRISNPLPEEARPNNPLIADDLNPDPITGEPGSHPIGTGLGAGGGALAGAAIGSVAGPLGTAAGAVIGRGRRRSRRQGRGRER
jgi:hypothetical protein